MLRILPSVLTVVLTGCLLCAGAGAAEIKGQVFIVLKSGNSVKLALAKVYKLNAAAVKAMETEAKANQRALDSELAKRMIEIDADIARIERPRLQMESDLLDMQNEAAREGLTSDGKEKLRVQIDVLEGRIAGEKNGTAQFIRQFEESKRRLTARAQKQRTALKFQAPSVIEPETFTDADGNFSFVEDKETVVVLIHAQREQPAEQYWWFADIRELAGKDRVLFSNHNVAAALN